MILANSEHSLAYKLLINPSWRWCRHLVLFLLVTITSFQEVSVVFKPNENQRGLMVLAFLLIFSYFLAGAYLNLYYLLPRFFLRRRFVSYFFYFFLLIVILTGCSFLLEYIYIYYLHVTPDEGSYFINAQFSSIEFLSQCIVIGISMSGVSVTILLKHWLHENQQLMELQQRKIEMEVEQVKEQISPDFLFSILHDTGEKAVPEPQKSSAMILHVSRLLRYQLYDGSRVQVLLASEIQFLITYLVLEQYQNEGFDFRIITEGDVNHTLIAPLLFLPLVQQGVKKWKERKDDMPVEILFRVANGVLNIECNYMDWTIYPVHEREVLLKRAILLYPDKCSFEKNRVIINL